MVSWISEFYFRLAAAEAAALQKGRNDKIKRSWTWFVHVKLGSGMMFNRDFQFRNRKYCIHNDTYCRTHNEWKFRTLLTLTLIQSSSVSL